MEGKNNSNNSDGVKRNVGGCDVEALKKCLAEHKEDYHLKCQPQIEAFRGCSLHKFTPSYSLSPRPRPNSNSTATSLVTEL